MGANDAAEQLAVAIEEVGKLERENADLSKRLVWNLKRADTAQAERDAALAVIEQVRVWRKAPLKDYASGPDRDWGAVDRILATSPPDALDAVKAAAWDEGVAIALNHAIRNRDGITLRLEHLDGRPWQNPYRKENPDE